MATSLPRSALRSQVDLAAAQISSEQVDAALAIANNSPMFQEALSELQTAGFGFNVAGNAVRLSSALDSLIGLVLPHSQSPSNRMGADLALTVDLPNKVLNFVQIIVRWSLLDMRRTASSTFDVRLASYPEQRSARVQYDEP